MIRISEHEPRKRRVLRLRLRSRTCMIRISEHEPRKGTETITPWHGLGAVIKEISEHEPRKGTETFTRRWQNISARIISEHEPRKGTETTTILYIV